MALKTKEVYLEKIIEKKDILINELVEEFGEEVRSLLEERFSKIRWVFFTGIPNLKREINQKYSKNAAIITLDFIKNFIGFNDVYFDDFFYELIGYTVTSNEDKKTLHDLYGENLISFDVTEDNLQNNITGIWAFNPNIDMERVKMYGKHRDKSEEEVLNSFRCSFLKLIKKYPKECTDELIIQDPNYTAYCEYYSQGLQKYIESMEENKKCVAEELELFNQLTKRKSKIYIDSFKSLLTVPLYKYLSDNDKKIVDSTEDFKLEDVNLMHQLFYYNRELAQKSKVELMSDEELRDLINSPDNQFTFDDDVRKIVKDAREEANKKAVRDYNRLVMFSSNVDLSKVDLDRDLSELDRTMESIFDADDGIDKGRYIVFDPYASPDENYDVHLRHELRHSLTSSVSKDSNGIVTVKVGNNIFYCLDENLIGCENTDYNEYFTQMKALEKTKKAYEQGIYILTKPGTKSPTPITSCYDECLPEFNKIYERLSETARKSQIELTNENLYKEISLESIKELENKIAHHEVLDEDTLTQHIRNANPGYKPL